MSSPLLRFFSEAPWLHASRARVWRNCFLSATWVLACAYLVRNGVDLAHNAIGTDFLSFYAASKLVLAGHAAAVYDVPTHRAVELAVIPHDFGYEAFFYPPLFLLLCSLLAVVPYFVSLCIWLIVTGAAYAASLGTWLDRRIGWATVAAYPALFINIGHGQNAFLSGALLGAGALWLERRPILAGFAFGLLAFKPHLGLLLPLALLIGRRWKTFAAAALTVIALAIVTVLAFGPEVWRGFVANSALARQILEQGLVHPGKMVSAFAAVRVLGGSVGLGYAVQIVVAGVAAWGLARVVRQRPRSALEAPMIVATALLASPFLLDYDLAVLAFPLAWLAGKGLTTGFWPWEKIVLLLGFALPLYTRTLAMFVHLPLAPCVLLALFALLMRRASIAPVSRPHAKAPESPAELAEAG